MSLTDWSWLRVVVYFRIINYRRVDPLLYWSYTRLEIFLMPEVSGICKYDSDVWGECLLLFSCILGTLVLRVSGQSAYGELLQEERAVLIFVL